MHRVSLLLVVNTIFIGFMTMARIRGPYSSHEQLILYRYGSLALFAAGVLIPWICFVFFRKFVERHTILASVWLAATLSAVIIWGAALSGGV